MCKSEVFSCKQLPVVTSTSTLLLKVNNYNYVEVSNRKLVYFSTFCLNFHWFHKHSSLLLYSQLYILGLKLEYHCILELSKQGGPSGLRIHVVHGNC